MSIQTNFKCLIITCGSMAAESDSVELEVSAEFTENVFIVLLIPGLLVPKSERVLGKLLLSKES